MDSAGYTLLPSGLYIPADYQPYPKCLDLFSGCGGMSLGFIQGGFEVVAGFDNDCAAAHTYMSNLGSYPISIHYTSEIWEKKLTDYFERWLKKNSNGPLIAFEVSGSGWIKAERERGNYYPPVQHFFFGDVREVTGEWILDKLDMAVGEMDLICGGPPCQGFSESNTRRNAADPRNNLVFEFARLVCEIRPKTMVMENVPEIINMVTPEGLPVVDTFCRILEDGGFGTMNALKKSLFNTSGSGAVLRKTQGKSNKKESMPDDEPAQNKPVQLNLF